MAIVKCRLCRGSGEIPCSKCGGSGEIEDERASFVSIVKEYRRHTICGGTGRLTCPPPPQWCDGTGYRQVQ